MLQESIIQLPSVPLPVPEHFFIRIMALNVSTRCEVFCSRKDDYLFYVSKKQTNTKFGADADDGT